MLEVTGLAFGGEVRELQNGFSDASDVCMKATLETCLSF